MLVRSAALALVAFALHAPMARADCRFSGDGTVTDVTPNGTSLHFGLAEEAELTLDGTHARVRGVQPIAFEGRAAVRDVRVTTTTPRRFLGVLVADAGTHVSIRRVEGDRARVQLAAGPVRATVALRCDELSFGPVALAPWTSESHLVDQSVRVRGRVLRLFTSATNGRAIALRSHSPPGERPWPDLMVLERRGTRLHVSAPLDQGVGIDAWIERSDTESLGGVISTCGCGPDIGAGACGYGYAGETYRGAAHAAAGTVLRDEDGTAWGTLVIDADLTVAITRAYGSSSPEIVTVELIPGLTLSPCRTSGIRVDRASITLPRSTD